jgi:hypothetical protein
VGPPLEARYYRNRGYLLASDVTHGQQAASEYTFQIAFWGIALGMQPATPIAAEIISRCSCGPTAGSTLL